MGVCWVKVSKRAPLRPWSSKYVCKVATDFSPTLELSSASAIKHAEPGETFQCVDGPFFDKSTNVRRVQLATAEGILGWASLHGADGTQLQEIHECSILGGLFILSTVRGAD